MKKIIVTGAGGFIGSHITDNFLKIGFSVIGIDNLNDYYEPALKKVNLSLLKKHKSFEFIQADILDQLRMTKIFKSNKISFLIHCAARAGVRASVANPLIYTETNVLGTQVLLDIVRLYSPLTKSILLSSSSVYGIQKRIPFSEGLVANPQSPYGATKLAMEELARQYYNFYQLPIAIVRPFSIFGPRGRVDMAPMLIIRAIERAEPFIQFGTEKDNRRDWTFIDDFVRGVEGLVKRGKFSSFEIFNLGNHKPIGIEEFVATASELGQKYLNKELRIKRAQRGLEELPVTCADMTKSQRFFGYRPQVSFSEGMEILFKYYAAHRKFYIKVFGL